jgi:hypothetical protein
MTTTELFAQLRTQLADAQRPGLTGVRALEGAAQTVAALEDAVTLMEQRYADKECVRLAHILRHAATPEQVYAATAAARAEHPEVWAGVYVNTEKVQA